MPASLPAGKKKHRDAFNSLRRAYHVNTLVAGARRSSYIHVEDVASERVRITARKYKHLTERVKVALVLPRSRVRLWDAQSHKRTLEEPTTGHPGRLWLCRVSCSCKQRRHGGFVTEDRAWTFHADRRRGPPASYAQPFSASRSLWRPSL